MSERSTIRRLLLGVALLSLATGGIAIWRYLQQDLTLSHYDARAHLVVARRVIDNLTPGWQQFGAVWLPLPHLLNFLPVQVDVLYRTGASAIAVSLAAYVLATVSLARLAWRTTGSPEAAVCAAAVFGLDPNVLYLASTPMTEPLLFGLLAWSAERWVAWLERPAASAAWQPGLAMALACLTRYEAWPVTTAMLGLGSCVLVRQGARWTTALALAGRIATWPLVAILLFLVNSRVTTGVWFITEGFFVPENAALGRPMMALRQVANGVVHLRGQRTALLASLGIVVILAWFVRGTRPAQRSLVALALLAAAALPFYAFVTGHPVRIRYMIVLSVGMAALAAALVAVPRRRWLRLAVVALLVTSAVAGAPPLDSTAAMVREAQWDRRNSQGRARVTACLAPAFSRPHEKILASMGSLAHYMQELSQQGFRLDDFIHEGTGLLWPAALEQPQVHVQWVLVEEKAEGGDQFAQRLRQSPEWLDAFERRCEGGGVALYGRRAPQDLELPRVTR